MLRKYWIRDEPDPSHGTVAKLRPDRRRSCQSTGQWSLVWADCGCRRARWRYFRFTHGFRDVEELLAQRGISVSYETVRCWTIKFGPQIAAKLRHRRAAASPRWHLDEMVCNINGERAYLWRAVDDGGKVLDLVVQKRRDTCAALKLLKRLLRNQCIEPESIVTDGLAS